MPHTRKLVKSPKLRNSLLLRHKKQSPKKRSKVHVPVVQAPAIIGKPQYPFYKNGYILDIDKIKKIVKNIRQQVAIYDNAPLKLYPSYKIPFQTFKDTGKYYIIKSKWNDNLELNSLTDYFTEPCRIQCTFKRQISPLQYWNKNWRLVYKKLALKHLPRTIHNVREELWLANKPCNNFRISVCLEVLKLFNPKSWLDISAGWGDRLLSALLFPHLEIYTGIDPNPCLHPYYAEMIKTFNPNGKKQCNLIQDGFENAPLPGNIMYDLVFSSPPFFDLEIYSESAANSLVKYKGEAGWFNGFLMPSIHKAIKYLNLGGHLVLYMGESKGTKYIPKMVEMTNQIENVKNAGMFYYTDSEKIREFFCWQKVAN